MTKWIGGVATLLILAVTAAAQPPQFIYTQPALPSREALERLNLTLDWHVHLPTEGKRDGIFSVQLPEKYVLMKNADGSLLPSYQILVQTYSGNVIALERDTGKVQWRTRVGTAYRVRVPLAVNSRLVFVNSGSFMYALDRRTGATEFRLVLLPVPSATPMVDEQQMYIASPTGRLYSYLLPDLDGSRKAPSDDRTVKTDADVLKGGPRPIGYTGAGSEALSSVSGLGGIRESYQLAAIGPQPIQIWETVSDLVAYLTPLQTGKSWFLVNSTGTAFTMSKVAPKEGYRFKTDGTITLQPGQHGDLAYLASGDNNLYAINMLSGESFWSFTTGSTITEKPEITDEDVFVVTDRSGLQRLERSTGQRRWRQSNSEAARFLAVNPKFVYAADITGRLLVLDRARGTELSRYDTRDFVVPVANDLTDRILLAAHDGTLICLHDREYTVPVLTRKQDIKEDVGPTNPVANKLQDLITLPKGLPEETVQEGLSYFNEHYHLPYIVSERAFKEAGQADILDKKVVLPKIEQPRPLGEVLRQMLKPVNATFLIMPDHVLIVPLKVPAPPPVPAPGP